MEHVWRTLLLRLLERGQARLNSRRCADSLRVADVLEWLKAIFLPFDEGVRFKAMTRIPDFSNLDWAGASQAPLTAQPQGESWLTPEGIAVKQAYGPEDRAGIDFLDTYPGIAPYLRGPYPTMYVTEHLTVR